LMFNTHRHRSSKSCRALEGFSLVFTVGFWRLLKFFGVILVWVQFLGFLTCMPMETFVENIGLFFHDLRATPPVLGIWPCKLKLDEEKSKHAGLGLAFLHSLLKLVRCTSRPNTCCWLAR
jgi:hypothetical protein